MWLRNFGRALPEVVAREAGDAGDPAPDWQAADPRWIRHALALSQQLPSGGWYVLDATRSFGATPRRIDVAGLSLVVWRAGSQLVVARDACPHMGARLSEGRVCNGKLVCPWHGMALGPSAGAGQQGFRPLLSYDDGYLLWVQLMAADTLSAPSARPFLPERPTAAGKRVGLLDAVIRMQARCAPEDVIANRLDPWHGVHYHPHSFGRLRVIAQAADAITVRVAYRVAGPFAVEVDARFHCSDPRSIVMTIVAGEGIGSVVETHATPIRTGSCAIVELTLATSERVGFRVAAQSGGLFRPLMAWAARRLWVEDARYAERLYELRQTKLTHEADADTSKDVRDTNGGGAALRDTLSGG